MAQYVPKANGIGVRFYVERNGKKDRVYLYEKGWSQEDAENAMVDYRRKMGFVDDKNTTIATFLTTFYDNYIAGTVAASTAKRYDEFADLHIVPEIGEVKLIDIKPGELQSLYTKLINKGLSTTTALKVHRFLHLAFRYAIAWGYMRHNPCDGVKAPSLAKTEIIIPTDEQIQAIFTKTQETNADYMSIFMPIYIASTTGMRLGEVLGLQDNTVDIKRGIYNVRHSLDYSTHKLTLKQTKTKASRRPIPFLPGTDEVLKSYIKAKIARQLKTKKYNERPTYFLVNRFGNPLNPTNTTHWFKEIIRELELPKDLHFHCLRHYHASWLLRQGVHPKVVQERLGHSNINITLNTYSHLIPDMQADVISSLDCSVFGTGHDLGTITTVPPGTKAQSADIASVSGDTK
jgi:integrase